MPEIQQHSDSPIRLQSGHIPALDGLRGLAVIAVILFHLAAYLEPTSSLAIGVRDVLRFGWVGVDLFFVLSGFLITGILYDNRNSSTRLRGFYGRRILRIAPLYYVTLAIMAGLAPIVADPAHAAAFFQSLPWHGAYLTNIRLAVADSWSVAPMKTGHLWSLAVEEQFYLVWPAVMAIVLSRSKAGRVALIRICIALVVASIAFRLWVHPKHGLAAFTLLIARMDALVIGAAISLWIRGPKGVTVALQTSKPVLLVVGTALIGLGLLSASPYSYLHPLQQGAGYTLWAALFGAVLIRSATRQSELVDRVLTVRPLLATGRISYGLYLLHFPVIYLLDSAGLTSTGPIVFGLAVISVSFVAAQLSWVLIESPILRLKSYFPYDGSPKPSDRPSPSVLVSEN